MKYYKKNMKVLKEKFPAIFKKIKNLESGKNFKVKTVNFDEGVTTIIKDKKNKISIYIEKARKSGYTMRVKKDGQDIYFHSKYAPKKEAEKIVKNFGFSARKQIFVLGSGLGYYLEQFDNSNKFDKIIVIEPYLSIFYAALCFNDLSKFLNYKRTVLIIEDDEEIFDIVRMNVKINLEKDIDFLEHSPSLNIFKNEYKEIFGKIKEVIDFQEMSLTSNIKQTRKWRNNIIRNLPYIINNPKVDDFFSKFENIPAICVSAGPSLDKNIDELKKAKDKALILCVGTALKALLKHNIEPDIVVTMDGNIENYYHFENVEVSNSYLLTELGNHYMINEKWNNKQVFFTMKRNFSAWVEEIKGEYTVVRTGGTVAHSMVDLAYKLGANPITLIGQDLAYQDKKTHASGTIYERNKVDSKKLMEVEGVNGGKVYTDKSFKTMLSFFNNYFNKRKKRLFIDATEGGAKIENTKIMKLSEVITQYCSDEINVREKLNNLFLKIKSKIYLENELKRKLEYTMSELENSIEITKNQIKAMNKVKEKLASNNKISDHELDELEYSFSKFEDDLNKTKYLSYFIERVLIAESMKLDKIKSKYYMSKRKSLKDRLDAYYNFRTKFLSELKQSLFLLKKIYLTKDNEIILNKDAELEEREGLT